MKRKTKEIRGKIIKSTRSNSRVGFPNSKKEIPKSTRSQEEMVGFVMIIILVSVIALIFLVISLRKPAEARESKEGENFLHSSLLYTSSCKSNIRFYDFKDLVGACYNNEKCQSELAENSCEILNKTAVGLIESSFPVGEGIYKAYIFKIYQQNSTLIYISKGNYTASKTGSEVPLFIARENLYLRLELYY